MPKSVEAEEVEFNNYIKAMSAMEIEFMQDAFIEEIAKEQHIVYSLDGNNIFNFFSRDKVEKMKMFITFQNDNNRKVSMEDLHRIV